MSTLKITKKVSKTSGVTALVIDLISPRKAVQQMVLKLGKGIDYKDITSPQDTIPQIEIRRSAPKPKKAGAGKATDLGKKRKTYIEKLRKGIHNE